MANSYPPAGNLKNSLPMQGGETHQDERSATVRAPSGTELAEITQGDGVLTRLSEDAVVSREPVHEPAPGEPVALRLHSGSSWHRLWSAPGRHGIVVQTPVVTARASDGAFTVVCEDTGGG